MNLSGKTIIMVPFRDNGDAARTANLTAVLKYLSTHFPEVPTLVVEQDSVQKWPDSFFVYNPNKFNKGWALNVAAKHAIENGFKYLVFWDADFVMNPNDFKAAMEDLDRDGGFDAISPYGRTVTYMTPEESVEFRSNLDCEYLKTLPPRRDRRASQQDLPIAAGIFVITAAGFQRVGGYPENFEGWGGEDCALSFKVYKLLGHKTFQEYRSYHMYHDDPTRTGDFSKFGKIYKVSSRKPELLIADAIKDWPVIGSPEKYR